MNSTDKTPKQIVSDLDSYIIGQNKAKKAVAVALRNRYRRMHLSKKMQDEITPKNLLMIGPTGVGKTEIARRLAKIVHAPFVKVEATKFTEVGYVGNDVESMVRDLVESAVNIEKKGQFKKVKFEAEEAANKHLVELLVPNNENKQKKNNDFQDIMNVFQMMQKGKMPNSNQNNKNKENENISSELKKRRNQVAQKLNDGFLENEKVEIEMDDPSQNIKSQNDMMSKMGLDLNGTLNNIIPKKQIKRRLSVKEARKILTRQESEHLVNKADIYSNALKHAEENGIIFIDEIDKITAQNNQSNADVSREGVQRDILPIVEGSQVNTKYGTIDTSHILFVGSGAFVKSKPSDLMAELQGRFPIRVELNDLTKEDFVEILTKPSNALVKQYMALIGTDNIKVTFTMDAIKRIADIAYNVNHDTENIGARRLHTILEKLLEDLLYEGPDMEMGDITITAKYVDKKVGDLAKDENLARYIL